MADYFESNAAQGAERLRVQRAQDLSRFPLVDGIAIRPVLGARLNINIVELDPGALAPVHTHDEEQLGYVVSGTCEFTDGTNTRVLAAGDTYHAPPNAPHGARALDDGCVIIDAFAPPRAGVRELLEG